MKFVKSYKKVMVLGLLCILVFSLSACDFIDGFKNGFSSKTEKVENHEEK
ncbi:hypothetical protein H9I32_08455 [Bacillus sp. Xin]|nr:hypothetical protein [Bacillus sp. Xin]MBC6972440.1 hypothetical protein [Bacillus sp. Xin]NSW39461.1 hypothetical protein [Bacillus sp. Xin1]